MEKKLMHRVLQVEGMEDFNCEKKIENAFNNIDGVVSVKAMHTSSNVYITYDANIIALNAIIEIIEKLDLKIKNKPSVAPAGKPGGSSGIFMDKILHIDGMTCTSCEMRIENGLKKMTGVTAVKVSYGSSEARITYEPALVTLDAVIDTIERLDYKAREKKEGQAHSSGGKENSAPAGKMTINQLLGIGIILLAAYLVIKNTVGFNFIPQVNQNMGYGVLFIVGLITSLHCIAMCGGINLSQCVSYKFGDGETSKISKMKPSIMYNTGRVISYTMVGGIVGALGSVVSFSGTAKGIVAIISGIFMVIMGLNMMNIFPWLRKFNPRMPKIFGNKVHNNNGKHGPFYVGLLNGLMPCGPLQAMQIYALGTGSFYAGALSMFLFSLGTVPLMFGFGAVSSFLSGKFTHRMMKVSAVLVMVLGIVMLNRGLSLSGINIASAATIGTSSGSIAKIEGNVQNVSISLQSGKYIPITVQKGIPVKWNIKADKSNINGCNGTIIIPKYGVEKKLEPGDNIIEFTPDASGEIPYSCWMGMIRSNIKVVDDINSVSSSDASQLDNSADPGSSAGGGCCGAAPPGYENGKIPTDNIQVAQVKDGKQEVTIDVNDQGYTPSVIVLQKGVDFKIKFNPEQLSGCNGTVVFPEYQGQLDISQADQKETPWLAAEQDFTFQCGMGMLHGYVKVVDDINNVDIDAIKQEVQNYTAPAGAGGGAGDCCG